MFGKISKNNKKVLWINFSIAFSACAILLATEIIRGNVLDPLFYMFLFAGICSGFLFSSKEKINSLNILKLALINGVFFGVSLVLLVLVSPIVEKIATETMVSVYIGMSASDESNIYIYLAKSATKGFFWVTLFFATTSFIGIYMRNRIDMRSLKK